MELKPLSRSKIIIGMLCLYVVWGTPFLARKFAIQTIPPLMEEGIRFFIAGGLVILYSCYKNKCVIQAKDWKTAFIVGGFLLLGGNGGVVWAQKVVPSGIAALFIGTVPMWMVLVDYLWNRGLAPRPAVIIALVTGFVGVLIIVSPWRSAAGGHLPILQSIVLLLSALSWAIGSIYAKHAGLHKNLVLVIGTQMFAGGLLLLAASALSGEFLRFNPFLVSLRSALSLAYLIIFASIVGFNIYIRLLMALPPEKVATYAYINPVIAISLGWRFAGESISPRILLASFLILLSVAIIVSRSPRVKRKNVEPLEVP